MQTNQPSTGEETRASWKILVQHGGLSGISSAS